MRNDKDRLLDIKEAIEKIEQYASSGEDKFKNDELLQIWVVHHLQIIGEATRKLSDEFLQTHPDVPWSQIIAMRNILVHDYFSVDADEVWSVVVTDMPVLKQNVDEILSSL